MKSLLNIDSKTVSRLLSALIAIHIIIMLAATLNQSAWVDEAWTYSDIGHSYSDLLELLSTSDVHPPLYYIITKAISDIVTTIFPSASLITVVKCVSILPMLLLVFIGFTKVRRNWGELCGTLFSFCVVAMPKMLHYAVESRMYSWALLFITLSFLYAYDCANSPTIKSWALLSVASVLAAWTHHFACLSAVLIYAALGIWLLIKDKKKLLWWLPSGILVAVLYLPQLMVSLKTFTQVSKNFWIADIGIMALVKLAVFPFVFTLTSSNHGIAFGFMLMMLFLGVFYAFTRNKNNLSFQLTYFSLAGASIPILTAAAGVIVSWLARPIIVERYIFAALGCFWLCFCILLTTPNSIKRANFIIVLTALLALAGNLSGFVADEIKGVKHYNAVNEVLQGMGGNDVIVSDFDHLSFTFDYITENRGIYLLSETPVNVINRSVNPVFPDTVLINSYDDIAEIHSPNTDVYAFLDTKKERHVERLDDFLASSNQNAVWIGEYEFDSAYGFNIYRIHTRQ